jgi:hypothetical protein
MAIKRRDNGGHQLDFGVSFTHKNQTNLNDFPAIKASKDDFPLKMGYFHGLMECNHRLMDIMIMMKIMAFH